MDFKSSWRVLRVLLFISVFGVLVAVFTAGEWGTGGVSEFSPDHSHAIFVRSRLNPAFRSAYTIVLVQFTSNTGRENGASIAKEPYPMESDGTKIQTIVVTPHRDAVECPRDVADIIRWSLDGAYADVVIGGRPLCRVYVK